jgi:hypothetical protein
MAEVELEAVGRGEQRGLALRRPHEAQRLGPGADIAGEDAAQRGPAGQEALAVT